MSASLNPLETSILALASRKSFLEPSLRSIKKHVQEEDLKWTVSNYILIQIFAFNEEWRRFQGLAKSDLKVRETTRIAKPAIDRIKQWPGLTVVRNSIIAHARRSDGSLLLPNPQTFSGVPTNYAEKILLAECAVLAIATVLVRHDAERLVAVSKIAGQTHPPTATGINNNLEFRRDLLDIRTKIIESEPSLDVAFGKFNAGI